MIEIYILWLIEGILILIFWFVIMIFKYDDIKLYRITTPLMLLLIISLIIKLLVGKC